MIIQLRIAGVPGTSEVLSVAYVIDNELLALCRCSKVEYIKAESMPYLEQVLKELTARLGK